MRTPDRLLSHLFALLFLGASALAAGDRPLYLFPARRMTTSARGSKSWQRVWVTGRPAGSLTAARSPRPLLPPAPLQQASITLLDDLGHLGRSVQPPEYEMWKQMLRHGRLGRAHMARLHVWTGEYELARNEQPERAIWHFRQARRLALPAPAPRPARAKAGISPQMAECAGLAGYDLALALFYAGAYDEATQAFRHLRGPRSLPTGFDGRRCLIWYRRAAACAAYHAQHASLGIPQPKRLDPLCGAAGLAVCLRALSLPYGQARVSGACRHTGEGSSAQDLLDACKRLDVVGRIVKADERGLKVLPKPLLAHVEGDHFVALVRADEKGVAYVCSDCGCWPGGRVNLTWAQWRQMRPGVFITVSRPGSRADGVLALLPTGPGHPGRSLRLASASLSSVHVWDSPQFSSILALMKSHVFLTNAVTTPTVCGFKPTTNRPSACSRVPKDRAPVQHSSAAGDPVNLATGEEEYEPAADITVYNPHGPRVIWRRFYNSLRGPDDAYPSDDFGVGWSHSFNAVVADPAAYTNQQAAQGGLSYLAVNGSHAPSNGATAGNWDVIQGGSVIATNQNPQGWSVGIGPGGPTQLAVQAPAGALSKTDYEARYCQSGSPSPVYLSATFDVTLPTAVPAGTTVTLTPVAHNAPSTGLTWQILLNNNGLANNVLPNGWSVTNGIGGSLVVSAPLSASTVGSYEVRCNEGGQIGNQSATFTITTDRVHYSAGAKTLVFPNGATTTFTPRGVPTASSPYVQCDPVAGTPLIVWWFYDGSTSGHFWITFHDGTQWTTTSATKNTAGKAFFQLGCVSDPRITDASGNTIPLDLKYGQPSFSGFLVLQRILDGSNANALLTVNRGADAYYEITSVADAYGRSVYYTYPQQPISNPNTGGMWSSYLEVTGASTILQSGLTNPPMRWTYGYAPYQTGLNQEQVNLLHTITVTPSPTGIGSSTATINYEDNPADTALLDTVTSTVDANGNTRSYISYSGTVGQVTPPASPPGVPGNNVQVTISNPQQPTLQGLQYTISYDPHGNLTDVYDSSLIQVYHAAYGDGGNLNSPTAVTVGSSTDGSAVTTSAMYGPFGNVMQVTTPKNLVITYNWVYTAFALGRLMSVQEGTKPATQFAYYEPSGLPYTVTTPAPAGSGAPNNQVTTAYFFDNLGNLTQVNRPGNNSAGTITTTLGYTNDPGGPGIGPYSQSEVVGEPLTITDNASKVTHLRYDSRANIISVTDASGNQTSFTPTLADQTQSVTYPITMQTGSGHAQTVFSYLYTGGPPTATTQYDESGTQVRQTTLAYGREGEIISQGGEAEPATYSYDSAYRTSQLADGNGHTTTYHYDNRGYLQWVQFPRFNALNSTTFDKIQFVKDAAGRTMSRLDGNNVATTYQYNDPDGLLTNIVYPGANNPQNVTIGYDQYDRRTSMTDCTGSATYQYGNLDELTSVSTTYPIPYPQHTTYTLSYTYFPDGTRQTMGTPAGTFSYGFDLVGRANSLTNPFSETSSWTYQDNGWLATQQLGNFVTTTYSYNGWGSLNSLLTKPTGSSNYASQFYGPHYDGVGNMTQISTLVANPVNGNPISTGSIGYQYDGKDELTQEQSFRSGFSYTHGFTFDPAGNPTTFMSGPTVNYNADNQVNDPTYGYEGNGNPYLYKSQVLSWDYENRLTQVGTGANPPFIANYNGDGLRGWKKNTSGFTYFLYDGSLPVIELDGTGAITAINTFGANGLLSRRTGGVSGTSVFYTFDHHGNVCQRFDRIANLLSTDQYSAFGGMVLHSASDVFGFGGQHGYYTDAETGLLLLTHRYYDPGTGRFLNRDPLSYAGGINLYGFVGGNPVNYADPLGLASGQVAYVLGAGAIGALAGSEFGVVGIVVGFGLGVALAEFSLTHNVDAAVNAGVGGVCAAVTVVELGGAAGAVLPPGVQLRLPFEEFEPEVETPVIQGTAGLAARAKQINEMVDPFAQGRRTVAALQTEAGIIVGGGAQKDLDDRQVAAVEAAGQIAARAPGLHAEETVLKKAQELGVAPQAIGTSRPFCEVCGPMLEASGAKLTGPRTAEWPK